jgi:hypothetical protein
VYFTWQCVIRGYVNLFPPWYFKITLSYIILALVLYQGDVFVCRFEILYLLLIGIYFFVEYIAMLSFVLT